MAAPVKIDRPGLEKLRAEAAPKLLKTDCIKVGMSTCGLAAGAQAVYDTIKAELKQRGLPIELRKTGCVGMCAMEPLVEISVAGVARTMYGNIDTQNIIGILDEHLGKKKVVSSLKVPGVDILGFDEEAGGKAGSKQQRIVLRNCGIIDPDSIEEYIARGGYIALAKALEMGADKVIGEMKASGLRGRGGAGFPTGLKWEFTRKAVSDEKFIICNGDEGDPGAYMDRSVLEGDPHAVVEGMLIGALAIGAKTGYFYIRAEYPLAIQRIEKAIRDAKKAGFVGENILGSGFSCDLEIRLGAGAFVCGEETALMHSIEGKRGTPRPKPPFPAQKGLWDKSTCINNVETLANIAPILVNGGAWFAKIGSGKSTGTKVFAVTGKVAHSGLVEIPMGTTLREIVFGICGGGAGGKKVKAIQTGGPSGGVIPDKHFDTPVTYETLIELGSIMGSGGMIVMDESDGMVDIAKFYLGFCVDESCGKCAPCRIGGKQLLGYLEKISSGKGTPEDLKHIRRIAAAMQKASLCALGQTAANPVLSTLRYFESEYTSKLAPACCCCG